MSNLEQEVQEDTGGAFDDLRRQHPAFAQIVACRTNGGNKVLYGSDFRHNNFITISIARSIEYRGLSYDRHHPRKELIEVALTEAQWATFVSSMNVGSGVPCTIQHLEGKPVSQIATLKDMKKKSKEDMAETLAEALGRIDELQQLVIKSGLSKTKQEAFNTELHRLTNNLTSSIPFIQKSHEEHLEKTVEKAKIEIHGYMTGQLAQLGVEALKGNLPLQLEYDDDPND